VGNAVSSSSGPDEVWIEERIIPSGRGVDDGGFGEGHRHWSANGPKVIVVRQDDHE
jgi:hypothetical protein